MRLEQGLAIITFKDKSYTFDCFVEDGIGSENGRGDNEVVYGSNGFKSGVVKFPTEKITINLLPQPETIVETKELNQMYIKSGAPKFTVRIISTQSGQTIKRDWKNCVFVSQFIESNILGTTLGTITAVIDGTPSGVELKGVESNG